MTKAVIFDMDGVLIDSEPLHFESDKLTFREFGLEVTDSVLNNFVGVSNSEMWEKLRIDFDIAASVEEILEKQAAHKMKLFSGDALQPVNGVGELLTFLKDNNVTAGLASSSPMDFIMHILSGLHITEYFKAVVSGEEVDKGKPEPDIFLKAAELLGAAPEDCIVIEDSGHGIAAAKRAGMTSIAYRNPNSGSQDLSASDYVADSMAEAGEILKTLL